MELSREAALQEIMNWLRSQGQPADDRNLKTVSDYLDRTYPSGKVVVQQSGRFGKVLIRLKNQSMHTREDL
ncbi:hypothetical protein D3C71_2104510 [compost metagenome]